MNQGLIVFFLLLFLFFICFVFCFCFAVTITIDFHLNSLYPVISLIHHACHGHLQTTPPLSWYTNSYFSEVYATLSQLTVIIYQTPDYSQTSVQDRDTENSFFFSISNFSITESTSVFMYMTLYIKYHNF